MARCDYIDVYGFPCQFLNLSKEIKTILGPIKKSCKLKGQVFCPFHCPLENSNALPTSKANWNQSNIIRFNSAIICLIENGSSQFRGVQFPSTLELLGAKIDHSLDFDDSIFNGHIKFEDSEVSGNLDLSNSIFKKGAIIFRDSKCSGEIVGENVEVFGDHPTAGNIDFTGAHVQGSVNFRKSVLHGSVMMAGFKIGGDLNFIGSLIEMSILFASSEAKGKVLFTNSQIDNALYFVNSGAEEVYFDSASIDFFANFSSSKKVKFFSFENTSFGAATDFSEVVFLRAPNFHGANIHPNTTFPGIENFKDTEGSEAAHAYRTLKLKMAQQRAYQEEGMFYALEEKARRNDPKTKKLDKLFSKLYEEISFYGQDYLRPLALWVILFFSFLIIYGTVLQICLEIRPQTTQLFMFSLDQGVLPFSAWKTEELKILGDLNSGGQLLLRLISFLHGALSLILVGLSLLAFRWRFKRH